MPKRRCSRRRSHPPAYRVTCDRPAGERVEYGRNVFVFVGPTALDDARIRRLELTAVGRTGVRVDLVFSHKPRRRGLSVSGGTLPVSTGHTSE